MGEVSATKKEIKGKLENTPVPLIFHSIRDRQLTGRGTFEDGPRRVELFFREGQIVYAASNDPDMRLGEVLLREGYISLAQYLRSVELLLETGRRQGEILVEEGFITPHELEKGVRTQLREIVYNLMSWERGQYVIRWNPPREESVVIERNIYELILRGMRRVDRFSRLREVLFPWNRVVEMNTQISLEEARSIRLKEDERLVLEEVDGRKTIAQVIEHSPLPDQLAMQILYGLWWARIVVFREPPPSV